MKESWLIQRLETPYKSEDGLAKLANAFSFGGGLRNGGLSDDAMDLIRSIFRFDYMGSAEFEYGAVPKALARIATDSTSFVAFVIPVKYRADIYEDRESVKKSGEKPVYVLCHKDERDEVVKRIGKFAIQTFTNETKENVCLSYSLAEENYRKNTVGWLELDNGYMFFKDKEMFEQTAKLFNITVQQ